MLLFPSIKRMQSVWTPVAVGAFALPLFYYLLSDVIVSTILAVGISVLAALIPILGRTLIVMATGMVMGIFVSVGFYFAIYLLGGFVFVFTGHGTNALTDMISTFLNSHLLKISLTVLTIVIGEIFAFYRFRRWLCGSIPG